MKNIGIPHYITLTIHSFLSNRTFSVNVNSHHSNPRPIVAGLPQRSLLSSTLFNIYVAGLPTLNSIKIAQFANDTYVFFSGPELNRIRNTMQLYLNLVDSWAAKLKIQLNPSKTAAKIFSLRPYTSPTPLTLNNETINWHSPSSPIKYLGLNLDTKLNWKKHIQIKVNQAKLKLMQLKPIINRNS